MDSRIIKFLERGKVMTLATTAEGEPWCANLFYAFNKEDKTLIFISSSSTKHILDSLQNSCVAASIIGRNTSVIKLRGAQIKGQISVNPDLATIKKSKEKFLKKFPFATTSLEAIWIIEIQSVKFTDNTLGFGNKTYWERPL